MCADIHRPPLTLDRVFRSAADGVFLLDRTCRLVLFSDTCERLTELQRKELSDGDCICRQLLDRATPSRLDPPGQECPIARILAGDIDMARQKVSVRRANGHRMTLETTYSPVHDDRGDVAYVVGVMREVASLSHATDERDRLTSRQGHRLGHSLREPPMAPRSPNESPSARESLDLTLRDVERDEILAALRRARGKRSRAARLLGISRSRLYRRMDALGIASTIRDRVHASPAPTPSARITPGIVDSRPLV